MRPLALLLFVLAGYQLIEVMACHQTTVPTWARLGYVDVVWLPPISLWLLLQYIQPASALPRRLVQFSFAFAAGLSVLVFVDPAFVTGTVCQAVIATFGHTSPWYNLYGGFYEVGLFGIVFGGIHALVTLRDPIDRAHTADLVMGTAAFMILAYLTQVAAHKLIEPSLPSLMCHYALVLAILLRRSLRREQAAHGS